MRIAKSRAQAKQLRTPHYQGSPCKKGHKGVRYRASGCCVECQVEVMAKRNPFEAAFNTKRLRARKLDIDFEFTSVEDLPEYPGLCHYCGNRMEHARGARGPGRQSPTIDRIDPAKGYTSENVVWACQSCNGSKGSRPATEEWREHRIINA